MLFVNKFLRSASPGDKDSSASKNEQDAQAENKNDKEKDEKHDEPKKHSKFYDALQQWANDNARDIEEDDSTPLRSGL